MSISIEVNKEIMPTLPFRQVFIMQPKTLSGIHKTRLNLQVIILGLDLIVLK